MITVPEDIMERYEHILKNRGVAADRIAAYKKWLRYFLDFRSKYPPPDSKSEQMRMFTEKLREKQQTQQQRQQAIHAVFLYFEMPQHASSPGKVSDVVAQPRYDTSMSVRMTQTDVANRKSCYSEPGYEEKSDSPEWDSVLKSLAAEIKVRHYSRKTLKTYANWSRRFQRFLKNKPPQELSTSDVKEYLTYLAVQCKVAASTQNQAFNSLLFLYRHALKSEFGDLRDVPRARKSRYIPMVLSRAEIGAILEQLAYPYNLFVKVLFGCGLRLFEGLQLRVRDFNFEDGMLTVHGKGKKDRTVPLPKTIMEELKAQIDEVARLHERDLATGYDGCFWTTQLQRNIPRRRRSSSTSGSFR